MHVSINKFNERLNLVEDKVENIGIKVNKLNEDKAATTIHVNNLTNNITYTIEDKRLKDCQKEILEGRNEFMTEALRNETYSKILNMLIHGLKENCGDAWETKETKKRWFRDDLGIDNREAVKSQIFTD